MAEQEEIKSNINFRDIKSSYILKGVFSFLNEKQFLNLITYNKELQNKFSYDIIDYKKISGKYKIGDKNGKGKEYNNNNDFLLFEGEYINGKRNGKGKEYNKNGIILFEGEYINGKRNGKGKEMYHNGKLKFEGEYINGN